MNDSVKHFQDKCIAENVSCPWGGNTRATPCSVVGEISRIRSSLILILCRKEWVQIKPKSCNMWNWSFFYFTTLLICLRDMYSFFCLHWFCINTFPGILSVTLLFSIGINLDYYVYCLQAHSCLLMAWQWPWPSQVFHLY